MSGYSGISFFDGILRSIKREMLYLILICSKYQGIAFLPLRFARLRGRVKRDPNFLFPENKGAPGAAIF